MGILLVPAPRNFNCPVIYIPTGYNYKAVDAVLAVKLQKRKADKPKAIIVGLHITISSYHSESGAAFIRARRGSGRVNGHG